MSLKSLILISASLAVANSALLGQITYAGNSPYSGYNQGYSNDATKVSYNSVSQQQPLVSSNQLPVYYNHNQAPLQQQQQQYVNYNQPTAYGQYGSYAGQNNFVPSAVPAQYNLQQSYGSAPIAQNAQYQQYASHQPQPQYSLAGDVSYSLRTPTVLRSSFGQNNNVNYIQQQPQIAQQVQLPQQQFYQQQYQQQQQPQVQQVQVQQQQQQQQNLAIFQQPTIPVQVYSSVQQQQQQQQPQPQAFQPVITPSVPQNTQLISVQHFPGPAPTTAAPLNNFAVTPKNAHHYPALATQAPQVYQNTVYQAPQQQSTIGGANSFTTSYRSQPNSVFRTSFTGLNEGASAKSQSPISVAPLATATVAPPQRIIQSTPQFTHTLTPTGGAVQSRSLAQNPINIPSPALVAPGHQHQFQVQQQQPQVNIQPQAQRSFNPSTAVSHASFEGLGVSYRW